MQRQSKSKTRSEHEQYTNTRRSSLSVRREWNCIESKIKQERKRRYIINTHALVSRSSSTLAHDLHLQYYDTCSRCLIALAVPHSHIQYSYLDVGTCIHVKHFAATLRICFSTVFFRILIVQAVKTWYQNACLFLMYFLYVMKLTIISWVFTVLGLTLLNSTYKWTAAVIFCLAHRMMHTSIICSNKWDCVCVLHQSAMNVSFP